MYNQLEEVFISITSISSLFVNSLTFSSKVLVLKVANVFILIFLLFTFY
nr:MAG TPA: hypothetical protein [Caudoviricetes sp.]